MKPGSILVITLLLLLASLSNGVAKDSSQWALPENAIGRIGKGRITDMAYSPDGKLLAVGTSIGTWLYDAHTGEELALLAGHTYAEIAQFQSNRNYTTYNTSVAFSPDGKTLVNSCWDGNVRLWDVNTRTHKATLPGRANFVLFSPDGKTLVLIGYKNIQLWDAYTLNHKFTFTKDISHFTSVAFSSDGRTLASAGKDERIDLWDVENGKHITKIHSRTNSINVLAFAPDGSILASGGFGNTVRLWDAKTGKRQKTLVGHTGTVRILAFSPDGETLASGSWDKTIRLWDVKTKKHKATFTGHKGSVENLAFSPDGETLASGSPDGTIRFWNARTGQHKNTLTHTQFRSPMVLSSDGKTLVTSDNGDLLLWDIDTSKPETRFISDMDGAYYIVYSGYKGKVHSIILSQDGTTLTNYGYKGKNKKFLLWNVHTGKLRDPFSAQHDDTFSNTVATALSPDGTILAVGKVDGTVQLWNTYTGQHKVTLKKSKGWISAIAFSSNGRLLATGDHEQTIHLWKTDTGEHTATFTFTTGYGIIRALAFSPDGLVLAGSNADDLSFWNLKTGDHMPTLGHKAANALTFSPDGKTLASGSRDTTVRVWDTQTGHIQETLIGHTGEITSLAFLPPLDPSETVNTKSNVVSQTEYTLASLSRDKTVYLWKIKPIVDTKAVVNIIPHLVESPAIGEQLKFDIDIIGAKNITGYQITIDFDTTALRYVRSKNGSLLSEDAAIEVKDVYPNLIKLMSSTSTGLGNDDGTLASVIFEVIDQKASILSLPKVRLEKSDGSLARPIVVHSTVLDSSTIKDVPGDYTQFSLPEEAIARMGKGTINDIKFSPDNAKLFVASSIGIWVYDANSGNELALLTEHKASVKSIVFSPKGELFACACFDGTLHLLDSYTYKKIKTIKTKSDVVAFSPDGRTLFTGKKLWNIHTGQPIATIISGNVDSITDAAISPDEKMLATTTRENKVKLWDADTGKEIALLHKGGEYYSQEHKLIFSHDGAKIAAIGSARNRPNTTIMLWNAHTHELISTYTEKDNSKIFLSMDFSPEGDLITVVRDWHTALHLRNYETGEDLAVFEGHDEQVVAATFSPDKTKLASAEWNGAIRLWDIETGKLHIKFKGGVHVPASVALSPDGTTLAMPNGKNGVRFWDRYKKRFITLRLKSDEDDFWAPNTYAFSSDWKIIAAGAWRKIRLRDTTAEKYVATLITDQNSFEVGNIVFSPDGKTLAAKQRHGYKILFWNTHTGEQIATLKGHTDKINAITFSLDGALLASCSGRWDKDDNTIRLWDTKTGKQRATITNVVRDKLKGSRAVMAIAFSPDGKTIASTDSSCDVQLWDVDTRKHKTTFKANPGNRYGYYGENYALAFSPAGSTLVSTGLGASINVWDVETGKHQKALKGHSGKVTSLEYSADSTTLLSGSADGTALFWEMRESPVTRLNITPFSIESPPTGKQLTFNINMTDGQNVTDYKFTLQYDAKALRYIPNAESGQKIKNLKITPPVIAENSITLAGNATSGFSIEDGTIATVTFEVIKRADVTLTLTDALLTHKDSEDSRPIVGRTWVVKPARIPEDANRDWQLDATDLEFVSSRLGQKGKGNSADINGDGIVDIADLVLVRNALYGLEPEPETD